MNTITCSKNNLLISNSTQTIRSISVSKDNNLIVIGQMCGNKNEPTLSVIEIDSGKTKEVIEYSENQSNSVYNVIFNKFQDNEIYYVKQSGVDYLYISYNFFTKDKKVLLKTSNKSIVKKISLDINGCFLLPDINSKLISIENKKTVENKIDLLCFLKNLSDINKTLLILSPNGKEIVITNSEKGKLLIYSIEEKKIINELTGNFNYLESVYYDFKSRYIFGIKENNQLIAWNLNTNMTHIESKCEYINGLLSLNFNQKYNLFSVGMITYFIIVFDLESGKRLYKDEFQNGSVYDICFTHNGNRLISAGENGKIIVREMSYS